MKDLVAQLAEVSLNLPTYTMDIEKGDQGRYFVFDPIRKKKLLLTPEEWVRQHITHYLVEHMNYPGSLIALEKGLKYNALQKRFDILVLDRSGASFFLIECKAPEVKLSQKTVEQVCVYNNKFNAPYICISNGRMHYCLKKDLKTGRYSQINHFPKFDENPAI
ncbi:type I restriction enzyme HsdR N-terminal domain-containing protein [uncultured Cyclobacterium sp.]|uniref:type I restriction enzyme HsdR N-terminal domain-containing protein n=1 Tax=uncultured Cyclobacterium sp. TaxID=453820 RepID=UPI0030EC9E20